MLDLKKVIEQMQPDANLRPDLTSISFVGLAAMGLEDFAHPVKIQARFNKDHSGAFKAV